MATLQHIETKTNCFHCGDEVKTRSFILDEKQFCCQGCQTVYSILSDNKLGDYYRISPNAGTKQANFQESKFDYLDDANVIASLLDFKDDSLAKITFHIPVMHCASCVWLIENLYKLNKGIISARVNLMRKEVVVMYNHNEISLRELVILLARTGYEPAINLGNEEGEKKTVSNKKIYYQLGIAGFCFGNVMLLSLPDYFDFTGEFHASMGSFVGFVMLVLALPVLFYSDLDYLKSAYAALKNRVVNLDVPISLGIVALFGVSVYEIVSHTGAGYLDSFTGLIFFLLLGKAFQQKTFDTLSFERDYKSYFPISITLKGANNTETTVPVNNLKVGDRMLIRNIELSPADAMLLKGRALIDYSFVTGESVPVEKVYGEIIYAGGRQVGEVVELEVIKSVKQSYLTQLWNNEAFTKVKETFFTSLVNSNSKRFTTIVLSIASIAAIYWYNVQGLEMAAKVFASVLIITCPCALALSTPFTLGNAMRIFGRKKMYLKNTAVIEEMAAIDTIIFDKTGTLSDTSQSEVVWYGTETLNDYQLMLVKSVLRQSTHPLSRSIYEQLKAEISEVANFQEFAGKGLIATVDNKEVKIGSSAFVNGEKMFSSQTAVYVSIEGKVLGNFALNHSYRNGLENMIADLKGNYRLFVLSGDNNREEGALKAIFGNEVPLYFEQKPEDKLKFVADQKAKGYKVMMVGDGLNDAGALKMSSIGVSITENVASFSPACDVILEASMLGKLASFLKFSKQSVNVIKACYAISLIYNLVGITITVQGKLSPVFTAILMPLSSITIMLFTTGLVSYVAYKLFNLNKNALWKF